MGRCIVGLAERCPTFVVVLPLFGSHHAMVLTRASILLGWDSELPLFQGMGDGQTCFGKATGMTSPPSLHGANVLMYITYTLEQTAKP